MDDFLSDSIAGKRDKYEERCNGNCQEGTVAALPLPKGEREHTSAEW
jgi:hypothetical protein